MPDKNKQSSESPDNLLHPIFGTFCRTQSFTQKNPGNGKSMHVHYEIFLEDPVKKTWSLNKVTVSTSPSAFLAKDKTSVRTTPIRKGLDFTTAVSALTDAEADFRKNPSLYVPLYPDVPQMGFLHFKAFAEREGYVFDKNGTPQAKPHPNVLPSGDFAEENIKSAAKNMQRPEDSFGNNGTPNKIPNTLFIFDSFNRAAHKDSLQDAMTEARIVNILDRFAACIETGHGKMCEYCDKYQELGQGGLIVEAEQLLSMAEASVRQLEPYGVETAELEHFVLQCQVICNVLHAQGLYGLMHMSKGDFDQNEALFKTRVTRAMDTYKQIDTSEHGIQTLKEMIVQAPHPKVPYAITKFIENYKKQRGDFATSRGEKPKKPRP